MQTTIKQTSLLNWINLHFSISSLQHLKDIPTLVLFIQCLFNSHKLDLLNEHDIPLLLNEINLTIPVCDILPQNIIDISAYLNGDQNQILTLLGIIQTQYQAYTIIHTILQNRELSFTAHVIYITCMIIIKHSHALQIESSIYTQSITRC
jgi:hypothetical protein